MTLQQWNSLMPNLNQYDGALTGESTQLWRLNPEQGSTIENSRMWNMHSDLLDGDPSPIHVRTIDLHQILQSISFK